MDEVNDTEENKAQEVEVHSKKPRKQKARRKLLRRKKERGKYQSKAVRSCDVDITDCIFSDEEIGADYIEAHTVTKQIDDIPGVEDTVSASEDGCESSTSSASTSGLVSQGNSSCSESDSRPASAASLHLDISSASRPDVSCEMECSIEVQSDTPSSASSSVPSRSESRQSRQSVPLLSAASDLQMILGASEPESSVAVFNLSTDIIAELIQIFKDLLPSSWSTVATQNCVHLFLLSEGKPKAIQREIILNYNGIVSIYVHCKCLLDSKILALNPIPALVHMDNLSLFCENGLKIVNILMNYDICVGANHDNTKSAWSMISDSYIDVNPYKEKTYSETCRSLSCQRLVKCESSQKSNKVPRCLSCSVIYKHLKKRELSLTSDTPSPFTNNKYLTLPQALDKMSMQHEEIRRRDKKIEYLKKTVEDFLTKEGVDIENDVSEDLAAILKKSNLSEIQKLFLEQQIKAHNVKNPRSRRWHPTMIRLALQLRMTSASAYEGLRDSGALILPSSRTLFDYSHAITPQIGVSDGILKRLQTKVQKKGKEFQKYCNLLCDEMYVSRNLVHRVSDNTLVGYQHLDEVERELANFETYIENQFKGKTDKFEVPLAKTMLAFMVKGVCSDVKMVVAAYPMNSITADNIYVRAWQVIGRLEKADIKVLAFVCDGAAPNRSFVKMHTPLTNTGSDIIFDTRNFCSAEGRPLFFIFDVCHLLKTMRNCFYNSGEDAKKPRCMEYNGEKIVWKWIVRLFMENQHCNFRKSYKLNKQNVFPNAFSCMKVKYAAQVLSNTVATDLEQKRWPHTAETVRFIRYHNNFFDCLNGAYKDQGVRTKNYNLAPYEDPNDKRFAWLGVPNEGHEEDHGVEMPYLEYLKTWKNQVSLMPIKSKLKEKKQLSWQVLHGTETTIRAFAAAVRYMLALSEPPTFVLGRAFSQDPLEQHFSLQRAACGGSTNPNSNQFITRLGLHAVQDEMGTKRKNANVEASGEGLKITEEALPKRPRTNKKNKN